MQRKRIIFVLYFFLLAVAAYLLFLNLGHYPLWDDEANTAIFSKNLLAFGELTAFDGVNLTAYMNGAELNESLINVKMPPMMYYLGALSFRLFGVSEFTARWPFAFLGFLEILVFMLLAYKLFKQHKLVVVATLLLLANVSFLLFARQCRYYSPMSFFTLLYVFFLLCHFKVEKWNNIYLFLLPLVGIALFLSHYLAAFSLLFVTFLFLAYHFRKSWNRNNHFLSYLASNLLIVIFVGIYIYFRSPMDTLNNVPSISFSGRLGIVSRSLMGFDLYNWFSYPLFFFFIVAYFGIKKKTGYKLPDYRKFQYILLFVLLNVIVLSLLNNAKFKMRFNVHLLPFLVLATAYMIYQLFKFPKHFFKVVSLLLFILMLFTSVPYFYRNYNNSSKVMNGKVNSFLFSYLDEINSDYSSSYGEIYNAIDTLPKNATIATYPEYMVFPVIFKYGHKFRACGQINSLDNVDKNIPGYIFKENASPDYIIYSGEKLGELSDKLTWLKHSYYVIGRTDFYWEDFKKPEVEFRLFSPNTDFNKKSENAFILKKGKRLVDDL